MIEAISSSLYNVGTVRGNASSVPVASADETSALKEVSVPEYSGLNVEINTSGQAVLQVLDSDTGNVVNQYPSEAIIQIRERIQGVSYSEGAGPSALTGAAQGSVRVSVDLSVVESDAGVATAPSSVDAQVRASTFSTEASGGAPAPSTTQSVNLSV